MQLHRHARDTTIGCRIARPGIVGGEHTIGLAVDIDRTRNGGAQHLAEVVVDRVLACRQYDAGDAARRRVLRRRRSAIGRAIDGAGHGDAVEGLVKLAVGRVRPVRLRCLLLHRVGTSEQVVECVQTATGSGHRHRQRIAQRILCRTGKRHHDTVQARLGTVLDAIAIAIQVHHAGQRRRLLAEVVVL
ncbi:hypothetical protein D3C81_547280 [compost metagenome]